MAGNHNSGRKGKAEEMGLKALLDKCITAAERERLFRDLLRGTKSKDQKIAHEARKLLLAYLYGTPRASLEISGPDHAPIPVRVYDYQSAIAPLATGSGADSVAPGPNESDSDGAALGQNADGG